SAKLRLTEDGTLEGDIRVETTGHHATEERLTYSSGSPAEYETSFKEDLKERLPAADVSDIRVENPLDSSKPFVYAYKINVPAYAERTGRRLFLKPSYFQYGRKPLFTAAERRNPVYFSFPWSEDDTVLIELPSGYTLESPDAPAPVVVGKMSEYKVKMAVLNGRTLEYRRSFYFGGGGVILFPRESYSQLKSVFDSLDRNDNHIVTLKQSDQQPVRKSP
ncbi:MAG TPA: hypothetical protein VFV34_00850, partial [Blastocatellia bacterium]|nr:hypothetical protein [Blastocatellia bacterium]